MLLQTQELILYFGVVHAMMVVARCVIQPEFRPRSSNTSDEKRRLLVLPL